MTINDIFSIAVDLINERLDTGVIDTTNTANYSVRTPGIYNILQSELCRIAPIYKTLTITASGTEGYVAVSMPTDYISTVKLLHSDLEELTDYKVIGNILYVPFNFTGSLIYRYQPTIVTALTQTTEFPDYIAQTIIPYGLSAHLLIGEDSSIASFFNQRYEELKMNLKKKEPAVMISKEDKYGANCTL